MKISKRLKSYLIQLPLVGLLSFTGGLILTYVLFKSNDYWSIFYLPFKFAGIYAAYFISKRGAPGGGVNYHVNEDTKNKDEIKLDKLIAKYNAKQLVTIVVVMFSTIYIMLNIVQYDEASKFNFIDGFTMTFAIFLTVLGLSEGIKYLSAWLTIIRYLKKVKT